LFVVHFARYTAGVSRFTFYGLFEAGHEVTEQELLGLSGLMAAGAIFFLLFFVAF